MANMPREDRPTLLHLSLPKSLRDKLDKHLARKSDGMIRKGAYQDFLIPLIEEALGIATIETKIAQVTKVYPPNYPYPPKKGKK